MGQALETFCGIVERLRELDVLDTPTSCDGELLKHAVPEIRELQGELQRITASRDRLFFEIQILQMTQGALKMEIDRLRAEKATGPTIRANDAILKFNPDGTFDLSGEVIQIGDVVPA